MIWLVLYLAAGIAYTWWAMDHSALTRSDLFTWNFALGCSLMTLCWPVVLFADLYTRMEGK